MQFFVRGDCPVIAAPIHCDIDGVPKGSHVANSTAAAGFGICVCSDKNTQVQVLQRTERSRPMAPGRSRDDHPDSKTTNTWTCHAAAATST
jgi:hypothetical protein